MIISILVIAIVICLVGIANYNDDVAAFGFGLGGIVTFILVGVLIAFPFDIDKKIELYETENKVIEEKIKGTVRDYMEYEEKVYNDLLKDADLTTMILKYPELNSNELVKAEIETYKENSKKIKELKEERIGKSRMAWWLYFGK